MKNTFEVDFANNEELRAAFNSWEVGKTYELKVSLQLDEKDENRATCTIKEVVLPESADDGEEKEVEPSGDEPVMMVMVAGQKGGKVPYVAG
jgi:hypothetical protein